MFPKELASTGALIKVLTILKVIYSILAFARKLGWKALFTPEEGIEETVKGYVIASALRNDCIYCISDRSYL